MHTQEWLLGTGAPAPAAVPHHWLVAPAVGAGGTRETKTEGTTHQGCPPSLSRQNESMPEQMCMNASSVVDGLEDPGLRGVVDQQESEQHSFGTKKRCYPFLTEGTL